MRKTLDIALVFSFLIFILMFASVAFGGEYSGSGAPSATGTGLCGGDPLAQIFCANNLGDMLNAAFKVAISVGSVLAMLRIAYSGYLYMGSADMWSNKAHAKEVFRDAIIGLLLLLAIWLILYQINPCLLRVDVIGGGASSGSQCGQSPAAQASANTQF